MAKLHAWLSEAGFNTNEKQFLEAYAKAHEKYRLIRYGELREVTNAVWVAETLCNLGFRVEADDPRMKAALNVFFQDYVDSLEPRPFAKELLRKAKENCKLGLISNFTYAPVVHCSLRKLGLSRFFNVILVSGDCGWRKPHGNIFTDALKRLQVKARGNRLHWRLPQRRHQRCKTSRHANSLRPVTILQLIRPAGKRGEARLRHEGPGRDLSELLQNR